MKNWKGDEAWKRKEPGARLSTKQQHAQQKNEHFRSRMEEQSKQEIKVFFEKTKLWNMEHFHTVVIHLKNPLSKKEFMERMQNAFPKLDIIEEGS